MEKGGGARQAWDLKQLTRRLTTLLPLPSAVIELHDDDDDSERECGRVRKHHRPVPEQDAESEPERNADREGDVHA